MKCKNYQNWDSFLFPSGGNFVEDGAMLLHREFVDTEEVSVSRFRGGRTGGEAKMALGQSRLSRMSV